MPPELREKILSQASQRQRDSRVFSPLYQILFGLSCFLLFVVLASDLSVRKSESRHLASIMNGTRDSTAVMERDLQEMTADVWIKGQKANLPQWLTLHYKIRRKEDRLKTYQDLLDILKEEINGI